MDSDCLTCTNVTHEPISTVVPYECVFGANFGDRVPASFTDSHVATLACITPSHPITGSVQVIVTQLFGNRVELASKRAVFEYVAMRITEATPHSGPTLGGTLISFAGIHLLKFSSASPVSCDFEGVHVTANVLATPLADDDRLSCQSPAAALDGTVRLTFRSSGAILPGTIEFGYYNHPLMERIYPLLGPTSGGTSITLSGPGFLEAMTYRVLCRFALVEPTMALRITSRAFACISPAFSAGAHGVSISFNDQDFFHSESLFEFHAPIHVNGVSPRCGPVSGGSELTLVLSGWLPQRAAEMSLLTCRVGETHVPASREGSMMLRCIALPSEAGYVSLDVSTNGPSGDYSASSLVYRYEAPFTPADIQPAQGPVMGGSALTLAAGQCGEVNCRFSSGLALVRATRLAYDQVVCSSPAQDAPGFVSVRLEMLGGAAAGPALFFRYISTAKVSHITPNIGALDGGTRVEIHGRDFIQSNDLHCSFGKTLVRAEWLASTIVACIAPPHAVGAVPVSVTNDNTLPASRFAANFTYLTIALSIISPSHGPRSGGTMVTLSGSGFELASGALVCRFNLSTPVKTPAVIAGATIQCRTPTTVSSSDYTSAIELSAAGAHFVALSTSQNRLQFTFHNLIELIRIVPSGGPTVGGTVVFVESQGNALVGVTPLTCHFDDTFVPATVMTSNSMRCVAPSHVEGKAKVSLGVNGSYIGMPHLVYTFSTTPVVSSFAPITGPQAGGSLVQLSGAGFRNTPSLGCYFGNSSVPGRFINTNAVICTAPQNPVGIVLLRVTNNNAIFGVHMAGRNQFYTPACMPGVAHVGSHCMPIGVSSQVFTYTEDAVMVALVPTSGESQSDFNVSVYGRRFAPQSMCTWYGAQASKSATGTSTRMVWISHSHVLCASPSVLLDLGTLLLALTAPGVKMQGLLFTMLPSLVLTAISPSLGPNLGGTAVTVHGRFFKEDASLVCMFGEVEVFTRLLDSSNLHCMSPPSSHEARLTMVSLHSFIAPQSVLKQFANLTARDVCRCRSYLVHMHPIDSQASRSAITCHAAQPQYILFSVRKLVARHFDCPASTTSTEAEQLLLHTLGRSLFRARR